MNDISSPGTEPSTSSEAETLRDRFSEDEWFLLSSTPSMIGAAMSSAAPSGIVGTVKEIAASMRSVVQGKSDYADNLLIQALLEKADNWDEAREKMHDYRERARERVSAAGIQSREDIRELVLADCRAAAALVDANCSEREASEYKLWSVQVARAVAEAASEGGFLGIGGERVSDEERAFIADIEQVLGMPGGILVA